MICIWSSWCHYHPIISCSSKIQSGLPFWCRLTQVVLEKRQLNGCSSSSSCCISKLTVLQMETKFVYYEWSTWLSNFVLKWFFFTCCQNFWLVVMVDGCNVLHARMVSCSVDKPSYVFSLKAAVLDFMTVTCSHFTCWLSYRVKWVQNVAVRFFSVISLTVSFLYVYTFLLQYFCILFTCILWLMHE